MAMMEEATPESAMMDEATPEPAMTAGATPESGMAPAATPVATEPAGTGAVATPIMEATPGTGAATDDGAAAAESVTIESIDIDFIPEEVTIPADTDVTVELPNSGAILHNFSLDDKNNENLPIEPIDIDIEPGATEQVTVNLPAGEYYFYCNIPGHEAAGMFGTLIVE
jgi:nitrite reductase (NO-forming)